MNCIEPHSHAPETNTGTNTGATPGTNRCEHSVELLRRYSNLPILSSFGHTARRVVADPPPRPIQSARRRLGPAVVAQLVADYQAGQSTTAIMQTFGLGKGTVLRLLQEAGIERRGQGQRKIDLAEATARYQAGCSLAKLAATYGCDAETMRTAFRRAGLRLRPRHGWNQPD